MAGTKTHLAEIILCNQEEPSPTPNPKREEEKIRQEKNIYKKRRWWLDFLRGIVLAMWHDTSQKDCGKTLAKQATKGMCCISLCIIQ